MNDMMPLNHLEPSRLQLEFVTTTGPPSDRTELSRYVVRSRAMHAFLSGINAGERQGPDMSAKMKDRNIAKLKGKFKLQTWSRKNNKKATVAGAGNENETQLAWGLEPWDSKMAKYTIPRDTLDPYVLLPMPLRPVTKKFLHHYNTTYTMNSSALNPDGTWISFAITDMAVLHSTMALVSWQLDQRIGVEESAETLQLKGQAIKMMNQRLHDQDEQVTNGTVGAVAVLSNFETMNGTENVSKIHMAGLQKMVELRGGLSSFQDNKVLQRVLAWSDILYSSTWDVKPRFSLFDFGYSDDPISNLERFSPANDPALVPLHAEWFPSNPSLLDILEMARRISVALVTPDLGLSDRKAISSCIYRNEHHLLTEYVSAPLFVHNQKPSTSVDLSEPFRLSCLLYQRIFFHELPSTANMHYRLVSHLRMALEARSISIVTSFESNHFPELLAWIAFIGITAASDTVDRQYFVELLITVCAVLKLNDKVQIQSILQGICWRRGLCDAYFTLVWREMNGLLQGDL